MCAGGAKCCGDFSVKITGNENLMMYYFNLGAQISMGWFIEFNDRNNKCSIFNLLNYLYPIKSREHSRNLKHKSL